MEPIKNITYITMSAISRMKNFGYTTSDYEWVEQLALEFYQEKLRGYEMPSVVSAHVDVNANTKIWPMPSDYIRYTKVAYQIGNRLWTLGIDNTIALNSAPDICNDIAEAESASIGSGFWIAEGFYNGTYYGPLYTAGGGFNINYYRVNEADRYIQFVEALPSGKAVIEYLSSGKNVCGSTLVPQAYIEPFRNYLLWQMSELKPELAAMAKDKERQYKETLWDANILAKGPLVDEVMDTIYGGSGFNIR